MNTVDIRNETRGQGLFWMVAGAATVNVVVVALEIGYKYETMRDWFERKVGKLGKE